MNIVKLRVLSEYICRGEHYFAGAVIDVPESHAEFLMRDAPGCFERVTDATPQHTELEAPPVDKMVHRARRK